MASSPTSTRPPRYREAHRAPVLSWLRVCSPRSATTDPLRHRRRPPRLRRHRPDHHLVGQGAGLCDQFAFGRQRLAPGPERPPAPIRHGEARSTPHAAGADAGRPRLPRAGGRTRAARSMAPTLLAAGRAAGGARTAPHPLPPLNSGHAVDRCRATPERDRRPRRAHLGRHRAGPVRAPPPRVRRRDRRSSRPPRPGRTGDPPDPSAAAAVRQKRPS